MQPLHQTRLQAGTKGSEVVSIEQEQGPARNEKFPCKNSRCFRSNSEHDGTAGALKPFTQGETQWSPAFGRRRLSESVAVSLRRCSCCPSHCSCNLSSEPMSPRVCPLIPPESSPCHFL